ncbi:MAG: GntR family transcriptional regulator [Gemmatimonadetes bacterium]|nr:GntR family transcriptional regulator [Gemmatimonadota bacterium]NNF39284.1 GntR family transcriptional regulator [Gemmatimonadota bacterium]NNK62779.1 GntR family transcriptional regulator [Gemmatimonadota bacterium]
MFEDLDPRSPNPLYAQIAARVRVAVAAGDLNKGDPLPSVRQLARTARVNPATVVQAYRELELDGFVEMRHGAGTFVQAVPAAVREEERARHAEDIARRALVEAARMGLAGHELIGALAAVMEQGAAAPVTSEPA